MATAREREIVDIMFQCLLLSHDKDCAAFFSTLDTEGLAMWAAGQLRACGFPNSPVGCTWAYLE